MESEVSKALKIRIADMSNMPSTRLYRLIISRKARYII
jgi:hypothetical protein